MASDAENALVAMAVREITGQVEVVMQAAAFPFTEDEPGSSTLPQKCKKLLDNYGI